MYHYVSFCQNWLRRVFADTSPAPRALTRFEKELRAFHTQRYEMGDASYTAVFKTPAHHTGRDWAFHVLSQDDHFMHRMAEFQRNHIVPLVLLRADKPFEQVWPLHEVEPVQTMSDFKGLRHVLKPQHSHVPIKAASGRHARPLLSLVPGGLK